MKKRLILFCSLALSLGAAIDASAQATVSLTATDPAISEGGSTTFLIQRFNGDGDTPVNLGIVAPATQATPADYTLDRPLLNLILTDAQPSLSITLTASDDEAAEADEDLSLEVLPSPDYVADPANSRATVTISANDFVVTNTGDFSVNDGAALREGTLRQAVENANASAAPQTITFSDDPFADEFPDNLVLTDGEILIRQAMAIDGPGADLLSIDGFNIQRIFHISDLQAGAKVAINGITLGFAGGLDPSPTARGGAILAEAGTGPGSIDLTISDCAFSNNRTGAGGGIAFDNPGGNLLIERCLFDSNAAAAEAGALAFDDGAQLRITDSTFVFNTANAHAGAILIDAGSATIINATVAANRADDDSSFTAGETGGGMWVMGGIPCFAHNSLFAGNTRTLSDPAPDDIAGTLATGSSNNLIGDPASAGGLTDGLSGNIVGQMGQVLPISQVLETLASDPRRPRLADNGGPTLTVRPNRNGRAIDAGNIALSSPAGLDQRGDGFPRSRSGFPQFQPDPGSVDIGAIEFDPILVNTDADEDDLSPDPALGAGTSLREAIALANEKPGEDLIVFSRGFNNHTNFYDNSNPKTITASLGEFVISDGVEIDGPAAVLLTLSGDLDFSGDANSGDTRIFNLTRPPGNDQVSVTRMFGLTIANGSHQPSDSTEDGGGIFNDGAVLELYDVVLRNNTAQNGGAIHNSGFLYFDRVTFEGNTASDGGGAIYAGTVFGSGSVTANRSTFLQNNASQGGAIFTRGGEVSIVNTTIGQNTANEGGGLYYAEGNVQITNSTIAENRATSDTSGGGIDLGGALSTPAIDLDNTIVAANTNGGASPSPSDIGGGGITASSLNNLISDPRSAGGLTDGSNGNIVGNAGSTFQFGELLGALDFYGGSTLSYLPAVGSPAIDNGDNASAVLFGRSPLETDQRGEARIALDIVDIGSVEVQDGAPILNPIGDLPPAAELAAITFTASATVPGGLANPVFSLEDGPSGAVPPGASIDPDTGDFVWIPQESDGPGFFQFDVVVARDDNPDSSARETVFVEIFEVNVAPLLNPIPDQTIEAFMLLAFTATAADPDEPQNSLSFSLDVASQGRAMMIDPTSGVFRWTPTASQAPGIYQVTVTVADNGDPQLSASQSFSIEVRPGETPIVSLNPVGGTFVHEPASFSNAPPASPPLANFQLSRSGNGLGDLPVLLRIENFSQASHGSDFEIRIAGDPSPIAFTGDPLSATVVMPDDESNLELVVDAVDDTAAEADEIIYLAISPQLGYDVGAGSAMQVIAQNDYGVTDLGDFDPAVAPNGGEGTLRQAVINAKASLSLPQMAPVPADITFAPSLVGAIILTEGAMLLDTADFSISGPGSAILGVSGNLNSRVFTAYDPNAVRRYRISGLGVADGLTERNGGGIFNSEILTLEDCHISGCLAENGGGITNEGELTMDRCLVTMNGAAVYGGGIDNFSGTAILHHSTISGNSAKFGGGIENSTAGTLRIESSTIVGNEASLSGGGLDSFGATTSASNLTVSGNSASFGGGIFNEASSVTITQSTISENAATASGGGILGSSNAPAGNTLLRNSLVAGNTEGSGIPSDVATGDTALVALDPASSFNLIADADSAGGLIDGSNGNLIGLGGSGLRPLESILLPLADNGGATATHALAAGSTAVDAGDNTAALDTSGAPLANDQRGAGFPRVVASTVDIGAFELEPPLPKLVSCEVSAGPEATITWESATGEAYDVFCSSDLKNWLLVGTGIPATGQLTSWTDVNPPAEQAFFIVKPAAASE